MPQPPADWMPIDDRAPAEPAAAAFARRSEAFAEDLSDAPARAAGAPVRRRRIGDGLRAWGFKRAAPAAETYR